jgi:competence protein ComEA
MKPLDLKPWQTILLGTLAGAIVISLLLVISLPNKTVPLQFLPTTTPSPLVIHITGAVLNPGIKTLPSGSRVNDVVELAGGVLETADLEKINLAAPIFDGQKIHIPNYGETLNLTTSSEGNTELVPLNSASAKDLEKLPGIGEEKAAAIIAEREKRGQFQSIDELLEVKGISDNLLNQIRSLISLY